MSMPELNKKQNQNRENNRIISICETNLRIKEENADQEENAGAGWGPFTQNGMPAGKKSFSVRGLQAEMPCAIINITHEKDDYGPT